MISSSVCFFFNTLVNLFADVTVADIRGSVSYLFSMDLEFLPLKEGKVSEGDHALCNVGGVLVCVWRR